MVHVTDLPILLVDDEPSLLHSVSVLLRTSGLRSVLTLDDSRAVLPLLAEQDGRVAAGPHDAPHLRP
jgi:two-component system nitrogen regulation response regulator GlnG